MWPFQSPSLRGTSATNEIETLEHQERRSFNPLRFGAPPPRESISDDALRAVSFNPLRFGAPPPHKWRVGKMYLLLGFNPLRFGAPPPLKESDLGLPEYVVFQSPSLRGTSATRFRTQLLAADLLRFNPLRFGAPPPPLTASQR